MKRVTKWHKQWDPQRKQMHDQRMFWNAEHENESGFPSLHVNTPSHSAEYFANFLRNHGIQPPRAMVDIGCGKARNAIYFAYQGFSVTGFDFILRAVKEAHSRTAQSGLSKSANFIIASLVEPWPFPDSHFDLAIDCYSSIEIDYEEGRENYLSELFRTVKSGGFVFVAVVSESDEFEVTQRKLSPGPLPNSTIWQYNAKFQKDYSPEELRKFYQSFEHVTTEEVTKKILRFGQPAISSDIYTVLRHP